MKNSINTNLSEILKRIMGGQPADGGGNDGGATVIDRPPVLAPVNAEAPAKPPMYAVVLHNDNSTFPDFVMQVLSTAFSIDEAAAMPIMMTAHRSGKSVVQVVSRDMAETRVMAADTLIATAERGSNYSNHVPRCELHFTVELETKGDE